MILNDSTYAWLTWDVSQAPPAICRRTCGHASMPTASAPAPVP